MQFLQSKRWPNLAGQGQWPPFSIPPEWIIRCIFGANLVVLAQIYYKLSGRQAKFPRILCQNGQNVHDGQDQWPSFSIPAESIPGCILGANLVILAQIYEKLSHGQAGFPSISQSKWPKWPWRTMSPFSIPAECIPGCMLGANLVILAQIYDKLSRGQAKLTGILSQNGQNDLQGQGLWP